MNATKYLKIVLYQIFLIVFIQNAHAEIAKEYQWYEAHEHVGETAIIEGIITYTNNIGSICFLNFHPNFEKYISIVIYDENFPLFPTPPEIHYYLKKVRVHGLITTYNGKAQIVINSTDQIEILGEYQRQEDFPPCKCNYPEQLEITVINVGQGDSTLIATPSKIMLADAGESFWHSSEDAIKIDSVIRSKYGEDCRCIDYVLISHFHLDHIGYVFLPETVDDFPLNSDLEKLELGDNSFKPLGYGGLAYLVLEKGYQIGKMLVRDYKNHNPNQLSEDGGSKTFRNWEIILESPEGKNWFHPEIIRLGQDQINLGAIGKIPIIIDVVVMDGGTTSYVNGCNPIKYFGGDIIRGEHSSDTSPPSENDLSVGFVLSFNEFQMFIGGDLSGENYKSDFGYKYHDVETCLAEDPYIAKEYAHHLEVLRVNHHGSSHSTNQIFVDIFDPKIAIFSVGDHNTYGHVNKVILDRILDKVIGENDGKVLMTECGDSVMSPTELCHSTKNNLCAEVADNEFPVGLESDETEDANIEISVSFDGKAYFVQGINYSTIPNQTMKKYYRDYDNDGYGNLNEPYESISQPSGYVTDNTDCNDYDSSIHPGSTEIRGDGIDQDCNGSDLPSLDNPSSFSVLTDNSNVTVPSGSFFQIYGCAGVNNVTIESGAAAKLVNMPGNNIITIQSDSNLFTVSRSGATVTFEGTDGTMLKIPATKTAQTIIFNDRCLTLKIDAGSVMLDSQVIGTTKTSL